MTWLDGTLIVVAVIAFAVLISGPVRRNRNWLATVTPLASIIGSGFLVSVPLLASAIGIWAIPAVIGLTLLAFLIGGAIRYNIRYGEPEFESAEAGHPLKSFETMSHLVLIGAYFISVAYYLVLLAAFGLKLLGWEDPLLGKVVATVIISSICLLGATKGLQGVERAEVFTVSANLAAIVALLAGLVIFGTTLPQGYSWTAAAAVPHHFDWDSLRFLMGLLIIVQGFETTRFMGDLYDGETRIKAMTRAQIVSSIVYVIFFLLMIPLFPFFTSTADVAGFIEVIGRVTPWLPFIVTAGAIASQFSASVADSIGASELVSDTTHKHITPRHAYVVIGAVAVSVIWATDVVSIVSLASRAFALFYALQCIVAVLVARHRGDNGKAVWFSLLAVLTFALAVLGIPAGA
ncbi:putative membrane protein [Citreicella sp. SE45]|uniref:Na+/proline symporter n=1 Tax=Salipiger thiooxidans TaxID=282683 RepID=A0A1G7L0T2_9RHOB|nr:MULTISPECIES: membrane protein [Salipiger]EEX16222.1 putative membrane protein [Citreicella sp. SE45]NIY95853.1 hypothetical protein [Salipiger sp. HF18]NVK60223.1 hypothetical protein [Paracoccaceae bacterium]SDF43098.1 hypothetical protein SAMN04488105_1217 [Salipiger thiooxidans]